MKQSNTIRVERAKMNITQKELAAATETNNITIGQIERGEVDPKVTTAYRIARFFGMKIGRKRGNFSWGHKCTFSEPVKRNKGPQEDNNKSYYCNESTFFHLLCLLSSPHEIQGKGESKNQYQEEEGYRCSIPQIQVLEALLVYLIGKGR